MTDRDDLEGKEEPSESLEPEHENQVKQCDSSDTISSTGEHSESLNHTKCPYCEHEDHPFFLKIHKRNIHPEQE